VSTSPGPLVVIGVGNILLADDAVGVRVIEALRGMAEHEPQVVPPDTHLVDGGTLGMDLLRTVHGARGLVLVDGVRLGGQAGDVSVLYGDAIVAAGGHTQDGAVSPVGELLAVARLMNWLPEPVALVGVEIEGVEFGEPMSPAVDAAIPTALDAVRDELRRMDERPPAGAPGGGATTRLAEALA
jgi:hydrogenase maturation protease